MAGPAVDATQKALYYFGPGLLTQQYWDASVKDKKGKAVGGLLGRLQSAPGAWRTSESDPHVAGRALDIILFAKEPTEKGYADRIVQIFLAQRAKMNFISVIYNGWEWNGAGARFPHVDEAHKTHIHIEWGKGGVTTATFASDLEDALAQEFTSGNIATGDYATA
ncbi:MAG TPA: hypothetical protein VKU19_32765 [Bryobacteraceae bacterium]|nr:hypothetical protein [Bryobacteraceae bacterium]